jgi:hypothetical protein
LGRIDELRFIRNRLGHCRRPHKDDLGRVEQMLRDLETGSFTALSAFNQRYKPTDELEDQLVGAWVRNTHETASRLVSHAKNQYDTSFELTFSRRPWSSKTTPDAAISGTRGYVWHARWVFGN